jgi:hypothetical protein
MSKKNLPTTKQNNKKEIEELVRLLNYSPLAILNILKYLEKTQLDLNTLIDKIKEYEKFSSEATNVIWILWLVKLKSKSKHAYDLLERCYMLDKINKEIMNNIREKINASKKDIEILIKYSFIIQVEQIYVINNTFQTSLNILKNNEAVLKEIKNFGKKGKCIIA